MSYFSPLKDIFFYVFNYGQRTMSENLSVVRGQISLVFTDSYVIKNLKSNLFNFLLLLEKLRLREFRVDNYF